MRSFYEFFAGGGMARAGLGQGWTCLFANDFDARKAQTYRVNYPETDVLCEGDVGKIHVEDRPGDGVAVHVVRHLAQTLFEPLTSPGVPVKAAI